MLQNELITDLESRISQMQNWAISLTKIDQLKLKAKPSETSWSALECLDHINRYGEFYIPIFKKALNKASKRRSSTYIPGWLGNKMANDMLPQNGKLKSTMKTFKSKNPSLDGVNSNALKIFIDQQAELLSLLEKAKALDLGSCRVKTTIPMLRLKLGDTLRFVIFHEVRHVEQAKRALS